MNKFNFFGSYTPIKHKSVNINKYLGKALYY